MTAVFTQKEGSQDWIQGTKKTKKNPNTHGWELLTLLDFPVSPSLCFASVSVIGREALPRHRPCFFVMLDCNLHRSLWSSCMDVPVPESQPWSGGWGRGGRGASCGLHFLWRENPARLSQEWNLKTLIQCCFLFVRQVLQYLLSGNTVFSCTWLLWNISQNLLRIHLFKSSYLMDHSS